MNSIDSAQRPNGERRATLRDVAQLVGISTSAASMALSNHPRISSSRKREVAVAAAKLNYVPNSAGRALREQRSGVIAMVVPNTGRHLFGHPYFMHLLVGVSDVVEAHDSSVLISTNPDAAHGRGAYGRVLQSGAADGAIVASAAANDPNLGRMVASSLPVVLIGRYPHLPNAVTVGIDDESASRLITDHLLVDHGLRRLAHISGPLNHQTALDRYAGFRAALSEVTGPTTALHVEGDFSEESGRAAMAAILDSNPDVQGIVAANDEMAFGAMLELRQRGLRVPHDIAIVGFDDFGVSRMTTPGITTIRVPAELIGRTAVERLHELMRGGRPAHAHRVLPVDLVVRHSCGSHPTRKEVLP